MSLIIGYLLIGLIWSIISYFLVKNSFKRLEGDNRSQQVPLERVLEVGLGFLCGLIWIITLPLALVAFLIWCISERGGEDAS